MLTSKANAVRTTRLRCQLVAARSRSEGSLWITEAIPGPAPNGDATETLVKEGYIMGDNIAYFAETYELTYELKQCQQGSIFCQGNYSRDMIFKRNASGIETLEQFKKMMRYNQWQTDALSDIPNCPGCNPQRNAQLSISNRADLVPANANFAELWGNPYGINNPAFLSRGAFGGIDSKAISFAEQKGQDSVVAHTVNGPTTDDQPAFSWSGYRNSDNKPVTAPRGAKTDAFDFKWYSAAEPVALPRSETAPWAVNEDANNSSGLSGGAIAGIAVACVVAVVCAVFAVRAWRQKRLGTGQTGYVQGNAEAGSMREAKYGAV
jgi:hypothetical protein